MLPPIFQLNQLDSAGFGTAIGDLFEDAPGFFAKLAAARPFDSYAALIDRGEIIAARMSEAEQLELINGHPRIGAQASDVSALSFGEQGYGRDAASEELQARLDRLNDEYERRFGFRFCIFVAGRSREVIATLLERYVEADRESEKHRALRDVFAIARDRLTKLMPSEERR